MIIVAVQMDATKRIDGFRVEGHAEYTEVDRDYDIVCASVSAVTLTAALGLRDILHKKGQFDSSSGYLCVSFRGQADDGTEAVVRTMIRGLEEISKQYPRRIVIKTVKG